MGIPKYVREYIETSKGALLVFDLVPNLKIVGTFHSLNKRDEDTLERLIGESDFVALESRPENDELEDMKKLKIIATPFYKSASFNPKNKEVEIGVMNCGYMAWIMGVNEKWPKIVNNILKRELGIERDVEKSEFEFCKEVAAQKNKDVYCVDWNNLKIIREIISIPFYEKVKYVLLKTLTLRNTKAFREIVINKRNRDMIKKIEEKEGTSIERLERSGTFVCGYNHALDYKRNPFNYLSAR